VDARDVWTRDDEHVKTIEIPHAEITAPALVLGLMRIAEKSDDEVKELVRTAREQGIDFHDHADIYGPEPHACERRFAEAMRLTPSERAELTIQTKAGIVRNGRTSTSPTSTSSRA
jgi:predicted oxidoreductase